MINNLPNRLTIFRMIMVPLVMVFMLVDMIEGGIFGITYQSMISALIFIVASLTDWFDGYIARRDNLVTNFGKVMDPLADKLIVTAVMLCLMVSGVFPVWCAMIILARDFLITGIRVIAVAEGISVAASMWGKVKTTIQMVSMVIAILFGASEIPVLYWIAQASIYLSTLATLISGISYIYDYRKVFEK